MKRFIIFLAILSITINVFAQSKIVFGTIDYVEGNTTIIRSGKSLGEANFDDNIYPDDMIKTENDGIVIIALNKNTGMRGTLTIKPKSVTYIKLANNAKSPKTTIELISGQVASKLSKISGSPSLQVQTDSVVMGVRGTEFSICSSVNGSVLVVCTDGAVSCNVDSQSIMCKAGNALEKKEDSKARTIPVAISGAQKFQDNWLTEEIEVFKGNAVTFLKLYEKKYSDLSSRFSKAFEPLQKSEILSKWIKEDSSGVAINPNSAEVMKEKKAVMSSISNTRKVLLTFERIYYRLLELSDIISGTNLEKVQISSNLTAGDFLRKLKSEASSFERRVNLFRYAEQLYELRSSETSAFSSLDEDWDF